MMTTITTKGTALWLVVLLAALAIPSTPPAHAENSHVKGNLIIPSREELGVPLGARSELAPGAAEDTLLACQARIPALASAGQRLLAEQSCAGAEQTRNAIRSAQIF